MIGAIVELQCNLLGIHPDPGAYMVSVLTLPEKVLGSLGIQNDIGEAWLTFQDLFLETPRPGLWAGPGKLTQKASTKPYTDFVVPPQVRYDWTYLHGTHPVYPFETIRYDWRLIGQWITWLHHLGGIGDTNHQLFFTMTGL